MNVTTPTEPTPYQLKNLYIYLEGGLTLRLAANSIGVTEATVRTWMQQNSEIEIRVGAAEAHFQLRCLDAIVSARDRRGNLNVRAMMFLLEARFPEQFARKNTRKQPTKAATAAAPSPETDQTQVTEATPQPSASVEEPKAAPSTSASTSLTAVPKPGRNAPCPCESGHKYKHCCGAVSERTRRTGLKTSLSELPVAA
jgi:hypothetical protein